MSLPRTIACVGLSPEINMPFSALSHSVEQNTGVRSQESEWCYRTI